MRQEEDNKNGGIREKGEIGREEWKIDCKRKKEEK